MCPKSQCPRLASRPVKNYSSQSCRNRIRVTRTDAPTLAGFIVLLGTERWRSSMSLTRIIQRWSCVVAIASSFCCCSCGDCVETPSIGSISPHSTTVGTPQVVLVVTGNHFQRNSVINWNGEPRSTTFVNGHQLTAVVSAADLATPAVVDVTVFSPPQSQPVMFGADSKSSSTTSSMTVDCAGGVSGVLHFEVNP